MKRFSVFRSLCLGVSVVNALSSQRPSARHNPCERSASLPFSRRRLLLRQVGGRCQWLFRGKGQRGSGLVVSCQWPATNNPQPKTSNRQAATDSPHSGLRTLLGEREVKRRALVDRAFGPNASAVALNDALNDGQDCFSTDSFHGSVVSGQRAVVGCQFPVAGN